MRKQEQRGSELKRGGGGSPAFLSMCYFVANTQQFSLSGCSFVLETRGSVLPTVRWGTLKKVKQFWNFGDWEERNLCVGFEKKEEMIHLLCNILCFGFNSSCVCHKIIGLFIAPRPRRKQGMWTASAAENSFSPWHWDLRSEISLPSYLSNPLTILPFFLKKNSFSFVFPN